ncbi:MAG: hypothetical protein RQM92_17345 [Candidatus Syntrophopropionicum ammoniitolerans]
MQDKQYLMNSGPTPIPPAVTAAISMPIIGHRTENFANMYEQIVKKLQRVFQTQNDLFVFTNTGTGCLGNGCG